MHAASARYTNDATVHTTASSPNPEIAPSLSQTVQCMSSMVRDVHPHTAFHKASVSSTRHHHGHHHRNSQAQANQRQAYTRAQLAVHGSSNASMISILKAESASTCYCPPQMSVLTKYCIWTRSWPISLMTLAMHAMSLASNGQGGV
jgi:hypothetical protein